MRNVTLLLLLLSGCAWSQHDQQLWYAMIASQAADGITTSQNISNGGREANPLLSPGPGDTEIIAFKAAAVGLFSLLADKDSKHRSLWLWCGIISGGAGTTVNLARK